MASHCGSLQYILCFIGIICLMIYDFLRFMFFSEQNTECKTGNGSIRHSVHICFVGSC